MLCIILMAVLCLSIDAHGADDVCMMYVGDTLKRDNRYFVEMFFDQGRAFKTNDYVKGYNAHNEEVKDFSMAGFGWAVQTRGNKEWHSVYNYPQYGVRFSTLRYYNTGTELGNAMQLYGFFRGAFLRKGAFAFNYHIDAGLAYWQHAYNRELNRYNTVIGTRLTCHVAMGVDASWLFAERFELGFGAQVNHSSNGALKKPNKGLNSFSGNVRLAYYFKDVELPKVSLPKRWSKTDEVDITLGFGLKRWELDSLEFYGERDFYKNDCIYKELMLHAAYMHGYCKRGKYGAGVSVIRDEWLGKQPRPDEMGRFDHYDVKERDNWQVGVFVAHDLCVGNLSIPVHVGCYLNSPKRKGSHYKYWIFQRIGLRYEFDVPALPVYVGLNIYAHKLSKSDCIEWQVGCVPWRHSRKKENMEK